MRIEVLVVPECPNTDAATALVHAALTATHADDAEVLVTVVETDDEAVRRHFIGSPTILVDGVDPFADGNRAPALACRMYSTPDGLRGVPDLAAFVEVLRLRETQTKNSDSADC